jgi:hypothetical protein
MKRTIPTYREDKMQLDLETLIAVLFISLLLLGLTKDLDVG